MNKKTAIVLLITNLVLTICFVVYIRLIRQVDTSTAPMYAFLIFCFSSLVLANTACVLLFVRKLKIEYVFLVVCLALGLLSGLINPPGEISDEPSHVKNVYLWSNRIMGVDATLAKKQYSTVYQVYDSFVRAGDRDLFALVVEAEKYPTSQSYDYYFEEMQRGLIESPAHSKLVAFQLRDHSVSPISYFPAILGVTLARLLHLGSLPLLMMARYFMLLFYAGCMSWAIRKIPTGKIVVFLVGLLPMAVNLAPSFSYDPVITAVAMMLIAQIFAMFLASDRVIETKDMIMTTILVFVLSPFKILVYLPIIILVWIMPKSLFPRRLPRGAFFLVLMLIGLGSVAISNLSTFMSFFQPSDSAASVPGSYVSEFTVGYVFSHPLQILKMFINTTIGSGPDYFFSMIGRKLTSDNVLIEYPLIICSAILLGLAAIREKQDQAQWKIKPRQRLLLLLPVALCYLFFLVGMLFWWTEPNAIKIHGVQGRYFIPVLPLALFAISPNRIARREGTWRLIAMAAVIIEIIVLTSNFEKILLRV